MKTPDDGSGLPVQITRRGLVLADVEAWCAAMRSAGAAADSPVYGEERNSRMRVMTGFPGAAAGQPDRPPPPPLELYPDAGLAGRVRQAAAAALAGRYSWVTLNGERAALLIPPGGEL